MSRPNAIVYFFRTYPFGVLLAAILVMIVGSPLMAEVAAVFPMLRGTSGLAPLTIILTAAAVYAVWNRGSHRHAVGIGIFGSITALLALVSFLARSQPVTDSVHLIAQSAFLLYVTASILRTIFRARIVDGNILCGAACVYLLAGAIFGYTYAMMEALNHGSFKVVEPDAAANTNLYHEPGWLIYFSYTTLTTVGFGDVLPATALARSLSVLEAIVGQIMLVVMMARLVGLHVAHSTANIGKVAMTSDDDE